jgi:hypothetical protein
MTGQAQALLKSQPDVASEMLSEAESILLSAYEGMKSHEDQMTPEQQVRIRDNMKRLVDFYETRGHEGDSDEALRWKAKLDKDPAELHSHPQDEQRRGEE